MKDNEPLLFILFMLLFISFIFFLTHPPWVKYAYVEGQSAYVNLKTKEVRIEEGINSIWLIEKNGNIFRKTESIPDYHIPVSTICTNIKPATKEDIAIYKTAVKKIGFK